MNIQFVYDLVTVLPFSHFFSNLSTRPTLLLADFVIGIVFDNEIRVYKDTSAMK